MFKVNIRAIAVLIMSLLACYFVYPTFRHIATKSSHVENSGALNLGLDLSGGVHLLLQADFDSYMQDKHLDLVPNIKRTIRSSGMDISHLSTNKDGINLVLANQAYELAQIIKIVKGVDPELVVEKIKNPQYSTGSLNQEMIQMKYPEEYRASLLHDAITQSITTLRNRVDNTGTKEPVIQRQGRDKIVLEMPGLSNAESLRNAIGKTAKLTFHIVEEQKKPDTIKLSAQEGYELYLRRKPELGGDLLQSAKVTFDEYAKPNVAFKFNTKGARLFAEATTKNVGKRLAIVLDDLIITAPNINTPIREGSGVITGNFSIDEANELVTFLKSGSLSIKLKIVEERVIGPTLGAQSIKDTQFAAFIALGLVMAFMIFKYKLLGIFANLSLLLSLLYMFGILSIFEATLTLPGIAGIILTIGMAVDANILIYERIKEELYSGQSTRNAVRLGFSNAFNTILDSNITTLIVAALLYAYGTGPIRGFAVTLTAGIISSMFAATIVTQLMIDVCINNFKSITFFK